jgi:phosphatidylserine decarboxylase
MSARAVRLPPLHPDGWMYLFGCLGAAVLGLLVFEPFFWVGVLGAGITYLAFRQQAAAVPLSDDLLVAPTDGTIEEVGLVLAPPVELGMEQAGLKRVRISCAPWHAGVMRALCDGALQRRVLAPAERFAIATDPDAAGVGRMFLTFDSAHGVIGLVLTFGGFGPRLSIEVETGAALETGQVFGQRRFGGWVDLYLPGTISPVVSAGQRVLAGETPIAVVGQADAPQVVVR